jgi:hypothetical protein
MSYGAGQRATKAELAEWRAKLRHWVPPDRFAELLAQMRARHEDHLIDQAGSPFREAFMADICAREWTADQVRLGADPPDFELSFAGRVEQYECVEVQAPGRRRGDELKADRLKSEAQRAAIVHVKEDEWIAADSALAEVSARVAAKAAIPYAAGTNLVVYLNVPWVKERTKFQLGLAGALSSARGVFSRVWVIDNGQLVEPG